MGIFEQLLEVNNQLSIQMSNLFREIAELKSTMTKSIEHIGNAEDEIVIRFKGNDKMNASMTAKALGIKQVELYEDIEKGLIISIGETKRIFIAEEVLRYKQAKNTTNKKLNPFIPQMKKKLTKNKTISDTIEPDVLQRLIAKQQVAV